MASERVKRTIREHLRRSGVQINGDRPFDVHVKDEAFYDAVHKDGLGGARDAYVDGLWDTEQLDELTCRLLRAAVAIPHANRARLWIGQLAGRLTNLQHGGRGIRVRRHYDLGNDLFTAMLDPLMTYSCGYWRDATSLAEAQEAKLELVCRKLGLGPGMRVLDIGCGWGSFARYAAERHGVRVVGITISERQLEYGRRLCAGLPVELRLQDYRTLGDTERFDAVVSIGMFEHVGPKNYARYLALVRRCLPPERLFLLHTIGGLETSHAIDPWIDRNIFPDAVLPSAPQIAEACQGIFVMEDWHNFGTDYDRTLMAWFDNFDRSWSTLRAVYGDRFYRLWKCYLLTCAGTFRARAHQLWQVVLSRDGVPGGHRSVR